MSKTERRRAGPGRLSAEEAARVPDRLMDAALALFLERGYGETTMDEIARKAGASTKTLYSRYPSKADVLQAVCRRVVDEVISGHNEAPPEHLMGDPPAYLNYLLNQIATRIATVAAGLNRLGQTEGHRFPEFKRMHDFATAQGASLIAAALSRWRSEGLLPDLPDLSRSASLCLSMATDWARIRTSLGDAPGAAEIADTVAFAVDHFLRGCGYDAKSALAVSRTKKIAGKK